jgi:hypothetical protein
MEEYAYFCKKNIVRNLFQPLLRHLLKKEFTGSITFCMGKKVCFHIALIRPFYRNLRKELTKMPKVYLLDTGMKNSLLNNFQSFTFRVDKGMILKTLYYKLLCEKYGTDDILFWRTTDDKEVDFVMPYTEKPYAVEIKYDEVSMKPAKYQKFEATYPNIPLSFGWLQPFNEDFF